MLAPLTCSYEELLLGLTPASSGRQIVSMTRGDGFDALYQLIGRHVASARKAKGISQATLASMVGCTRVSIVNIESGRQRPPINLLWLIALALDREVVQFIPYKRDIEAAQSPVQLKPEIVAQIEDAARNNPETQRLLTEFIQRATARTDGNENISS